MELSKELGVLNAMRMCTMQLWDMTSENIGSYCHEGSCKLDSNTFVDQGDKIFVGTCIWNVPIYL